MNTKTTPKDFFLHLGATIALYASAIALLNLIFEVINNSVVDKLTANYGYIGASQIAWPISMLVVLVPILYVIEWFIGRDIKVMPEKFSIAIRRFRIFLTLFLTGATIAVDLIVLINTYLNGEVSGRFIWKVLAVLIVAAIIFTYYLLERIESSEKSKLWIKILAWVGIVIVLASIIAGFVIVGSPTKQRNLRFDQQRTNDLGSIQYQIVNYWQHNAKLPADLNAINDSISGFIAPKDPENATAYEYSVSIPDSAAGQPSFKLCATFALVSPANQAITQSVPTIKMPGRSLVDDVWTHPAGHYCYDRTIDPKLYPQIKGAAI